MAWRTALCGLGLAALAVAGTACQRAGTGGRSGAYMDAHATYPWQQRGWQNPVAPPPAQEEPPAVAPTGAVELPNSQGHHPLFGQQDTLDPALLPGTWQLAAYISNEEDYLADPTKQIVYKFSANGTFSLLNIVDNEVRKTSDGTWEKPGPGMLLAATGGGTPYTYYGQFHGHDFLFLWTFEGQNGLWLVRRPEKFSEGIQGNDFTFTSGEHLHITQASANSFTGTISGPVEMEADGGYVNGVVYLRWIDRKNNVDGYAAFVVSPDWKELHGVWWLSDFTSAPFGGSWETSESPPTPVAPPVQPPAPAAPPGGGSAPGSGQPPAAPGTPDAPEPGGSPPVPPPGSQV